MRRDNREKTAIALSELETRVPELLDDVQNSLFSRAADNLNQNTRSAGTIDEVKTILAEHGGFIKAMWCGGLECEMKMKDEAGVSSRCIPFEQERVGDTCAVCGKPADTMVVWGVAY